MDLRHGNWIINKMIFSLSPVVPGAPPTPPSVSKHMETVETKISFFTSLCLLGKNCHFLSFMVVFSKSNWYMYTSITCSHETFPHSAISYALSVLQYCQLLCFACHAQYLTHFLSCCCRHHYSSCRRLCECSWWGTQQFWIRGLSGGDWLPWNSDSVLCHG